MKKIFNGILVVIFTLLLFGCRHRQPNWVVDDDERYKPTMTYDELYSDSFDILLRSLDHNPDYSDSLYTRAYIALKTAQDEPSAMRVISKVDSLVKIDGNKKNVMNYLKMRLIALGVMNKTADTKQKKWIRNQVVDTQIRVFNLYPKNSTERLSSLGMLYWSINEKDSAKYYLRKSIEVSNRLLNSGESDVWLKAINAKLVALLLLEGDDAAKSFLKIAIHNAKDGQEEEILESIQTNFGSYKELVLSSAQLP